MNTADLNRRLDNLIRYGVIEETDFTSDPVQPRVRVRTGGILTTWIPIATVRANTDAEHDPVQLGEHVILLAPSGETAQAVVIGKLFSTDFPSPDISPTNHRRVYRDGYQIDYEVEEHLLTHRFPDAAVFSYDAENSAHHAHYPDDTQVTYDAKAHLFTALFTDQARFSYDAENSVRQAHYPDGTKTTYDAKAHLFTALFTDQAQFSYHAAAHLLTMRFPDGSVLSYDAADSHLAAILAGAGSMEVVASGGISITGDVTLNGNLTQTGSQTITGDVELSGSQSVTGDISHIGDLQQQGSQLVDGVITAQEFIEG